MNAPHGSDLTGPSPAGRSEPVVSAPSVLVVHPSAELYGSDRMLHESVRGLVQAGCRVTVVLPGPGPLVPLLLGTGARVQLVPTLVLRKALLRPTGLVRLVLLAVGTFPAMVRHLRETGPDLVLVSTVTLPTWLLLARLARRPAVCHVHEAEELPRALSLLLHAQLLLARRVVVNSVAAREVVAEVPRLRRRVRLVYNGVPGPPAPVRPARREVSGPVRLLLVGRVSPRKGTDVAVRAVAELRRRGVRAELAVVGDVFAGYEWFSDQLDALVTELDLTAQVQRVPFQPDVWSWYEDCDVVLVPSRAEPFGNVAVEAARAGRPVVASRVQGLTEIVRHGDNGLLVAPGDPAALADAVVQLFDDWPYALELAKTAQRDAEQRFSTGAFAGRLLAVLVDVGLRVPVPSAPARHLVREAPAPGVTEQDPRT